MNDGDMKKKKESSEILEDKKHQSQFLKQWVRLVKYVVVLGVGGLIRGLYAGD